jgi:hypothetical protein
MVHIDPIGIYSRRIVPTRSCLRRTWARPPAFHHHRFQHEQLPAEGACGSLQRAGQEPLYGGHPAPKSARASTPRPSTQGWGKVRGLLRRCGRQRSIPRSGQCGALAGTPVPCMGLSAAGSDAAHLFDGLVEQKRDVGHGVSLAPPVIPCLGRRSKRKVPGRRI